jgi:DNA-directed RNA polymerase subunit RPC12/RpoP
MATNEELALDGNAVAGLLAEAMGEDITGRSGRCPDCGRDGAIATLRAYTHAPGVVLRCPACDSVQLVLVRSPLGLRHMARVVLAPA